MAGELAYLDRAYTGGFERPYGWAWLLMLHAEAQRHDDRTGPTHWRRWRNAFADRFKTFLPKLTYPIRAGTHFNTAFALVLAREWADANDTALGGLIARTRRATGYGGDRDCPAWEPGGDDFLSSALDRGAADAPRACRRRVCRLVRGLPAAPREGEPTQPVHAGLRLATAATARSPIWTA